MIGRGAPLRRLATTRAGDRRVRGSNRGILGGVLLQQPGGQFARQGAGAGFALVESHQLVLLVGVEHEFKDGLGLLQPLLTETVVCGGCGVAHGSRRGRIR